MEKSKKRVLYGRHSYGRVVIIGKIGTVNIGNFTSIASLKVITQGHFSDWGTTFPFNQFKQWEVDNYNDPSFYGNLEIGSDVWIGSDCIVLGGVSIGHGAVIGAGSVVTKDVEPYSKVIGNPARVIGKRFPDHVIPALLKLAWWDWRDEKIKEHISYIYGPNLLALTKEEDYVCF